MGERRADSRPNLTGVIVSGESSAGVVVSGVSPIGVVGSGINVKVPVCIYCQRNRGIYAGYVG